MEDIIKISIKNDQKTINNRRLDEMLEDFSSDEKEYIFITNIFKKVNNQNDIINELKLIKSKTTPTSLLLILKTLGKISISEAQPILDKILKG
ncbi:MULTISPECIES: hypothetical protein [Chryseobacterium]|uniref:Uncharacterized protein n=1 Tax=Chryseobacterium taihuense TaxID=1141221 RepID=A0A4U8WCG0_9FLAO|nr:MULTISPECIES: hypothetical protein [Chryseobacterium]QQV02744.1 hypothetical protein I6I61_17035 [Chryseobacterium sp. FDAARGOS 1104]VFB03992.1 Uncharacterised protein [Chryseobacterium taihuense]